MDILHPKISTQLMPVLVWIHGGAWRSGDKKEGLKHLVSFARQGFFCASIEYRLSHEAIFPAQIQDCKCAIRFLRAHAREFHIDPHHIGVWGVSAGGHLAALLGTTHHIQEFEGSGGWENYSSCVQAVCDWFGPTDFLRINDSPRKIDFTPAGSPEAALIGGLIEENQEKAAKVNPITFVSKEASPFLIVHGDNDSLVPLNQSQLLFDALQKADVEVTLEVIKGGKHGNEKKFGSRALSQKMEKFFKKHLT
ncbi:alpha/beta hydrolase [Gloeocapsopsis dulcis]|nr:alpha/beta hydrolase [Gloeocapsopsis dulcis]WNN92069.1 alpha/beta hydrolase [Gloeocapsopsis dulcis]